MKKNFFSFFLLAIIATIFTTSCNKVGELCFDFAQNSTISTNTVAAAGPLTVTKSLGTALVDALTGKGVKVENVNTVNVKAITITIPSTAGYTFEDISAAEVLVNGISLGKLPAGTKGYVATFSTPSQSDFKSAFLSNTGATMVFNATVIKPIAASTLSIQIPLNTCYQVL